MFISKLAGVVESEPAEEPLACGRICDDQAREAKLIQSSLLPAKGFCHESVEIAFRFIPFADVGGDFADFFLLPNGFIGIYLGDVVGKGLPAAMYSALVMGILRGIHKTGTDTAYVLGLLNQRLAQHPISGRFCCTLYAVFDPATRELIFSNAGNAAAPAGLTSPLSADRRGWIALGNVPGRHLQTARRATQPGRLRSVRDRRPA